jgi:hypothetical protein
MSEHVGKPDSRSGFESIEVFSNAATSIPFADVEAGA